MALRVSLVACSASAATSGSVPSCGFLVLTISGPGVHRYRLQVIRAYLTQRRCKRETCCCRANRHTSMLMNALIGLVRRVQNIWTHAACPGNILVQECGLACICWGKFGRVQPPAIMFRDVASHILAYTYIDTRLHMGLQKYKVQGTRNLQVTTYPGLKRVPLFWQTRLREASMHAGCHYCRNMSSPEQHELGEDEVAKVRKKESGRCRLF